MMKTGTRSLWIDCPEQWLGDLKPPLAVVSARDPDILPGEAIINGVVLPQSVIEELRKLGIPLTWYNRGELEDAVEACVMDARLIDDKQGVNFRDQLKLTSNEQQPRKEPRRRSTKNSRWDEEEDEYCSEERSAPSITNISIPVLDHISVR
jgi:hypothetical protein